MWTIAIVAACAWCFMAFLTMMTLDGPWGRKEVGVFFTWPLFFARFVLRVPKFVIGGIKDSLDVFKETGKS